MNKHRFFNENRTFATGDYVVAECVEFIESATEGLLDKEVYYKKM